MWEKLFYFFYVASRGYSLPTSLTSWFVIFLFSLKSNGNLIYGLIALCGIVSAHLGTNLFDDCIDTIKKVPKQKCKTEYLDNNIFSLKFILIATIIYFLIASIIGLYFFKIFGLNILLLASIAGIIILLYPRLNHYALGEIAVGFTFGPLLFAGMSYVMTNNIPLNTIILSIPIGIFIMNLLFVHSIMDLGFDRLNNKKTLAVRLGNENSIIALCVFSLIALVIHIYLISQNIINNASLLAVIPVIYYYFIGLKKLKHYQEGDFMKIFKQFRDASLWYNIILGTSLLW